MHATLPQLAGQIFITEAGLETELVFHHDIDLPDFASFPLLETIEGRKLLRDYYQAFVDVARRDGTGVVFETPTWRANPDWGTRLGYSADALYAVNRGAIAFLEQLRADNADVPFVISGNLGPRGDGYVIGTTMTPDQAAGYHGPQVRSFATAGADMISALTMSYADEPIGMVIAAQEAGIPIAIGFTVETDGELPSGQSLADAINQVDRATAEGPAYYTLNCAHPAHFTHVLASPGPWHRVRAVRANASRMSHEELDNAMELDRGNEADLAAGYVAIRSILPQLAVVGGCCGTDLAHVKAISRALVNPISGVAERRAS